MTIRTATHDDADAIFRVHVASILTLCAADYTPAQLQAWTMLKQPENYRRGMDRGERFWVAEIDSQIVAFVSFERDHITALYVDPSAARQKIGSSLLSTAESHASSLGLSHARLNSTLTSLPFYLRQGYTQHDHTTYRLPDGTLLPCIAMSKPL